MAKYNGLLLFMMVLLACSTIPARISGRSMDGTELRMAGASGAGAILRSYNGCSHNTQSPHEPDANFCCDKDNECWTTLQECMPNCPCKTCGKKGQRSELADMAPTSSPVHGRSMDAMIDSDGTEITGPNGGAGAILRSYNGCSYNQKPHDLNNLFCCDKDNECWGSLQECMPNCPCHTCGKKGHRSSEASMAPADSPVQG